MNDSTNPYNKRLLSLFKYLVIGILLCFSQYCVAQTMDSLLSMSTIFKELKRDSILKLTFETNTKLLINKKFKEEWQKSNLRLVGVDGDSLKWKAKVRARGNIRKKVCFYPPIKLKFKKKWLVKKGLDSTFNDLKIVVGCKKGDFYNDLVLKEYLVYKLYEELTNISFRTQLAEITFIDTGNKWKPFTTYAFIIENEDEMATRLNAKCTKPRKLRSKYMYADQLDKMTIFEYMIGNTDWAAHTSHNIRLIKCKDYPLPLAIPYDFDYSGFVNAPYAVHGEGITLSSITQRLYLGICREAGVLEKQIPLFKEKKAAFYEIVNAFHYLPEKERKRIIQYLDEFYDILDHPRRFKRLIADACREHGR